MEALTLNGPRQCSIMFNCRSFSYLGGCDTDFRTSVDVDTAVRLTRDGASDSVGDTDTESTTLEAVSHGEDSVGSLSRLRDEDADVVPEDRSLAIQEVTCQLG